MARAAPGRRWRLGAAGFVFNHTCYRVAKLPAGVYPTDRGPLPAAAVPTVTTDAILAARPGVKGEMVEAILNVLNSLELRAEAYSLVQRDLALGTPMQDSGLFVAFRQQATGVIREIEWRLSMAATQTPAARQSEAA